jgi:hypothetical protein
MMNLVLPLTKQTAVESSIVYLGQLFNPSAVQQAKETMQLTLTNSAADLAYHSR